MIAVLAASVQGYSCTQPLGTLASPQNAAALPEVIARLESAEETGGREQQIPY